MRKFLMAAMLATSVQGAQAADMPDYALRGGYNDIGVRRPLWDGLYIGGQAAQGWLTTKPAAGYNSAIESTYSALNGPTIFGTSFPTTEARKQAFGGFVGYNSQWEDVVVGLEGNYLHSDIAANAIAFSPAGVTPVSQTSINLALTDFGSVRLRGGYMVGSFLPYAYVGFAAGSANVLQQAGVPSAVGVPFQTASSTLFVYGYSAGVGLDVLLVGGLFARAEYEYTQFTSSRINASLNTVKVGLGYKF